MSYNTHTMTHQHNHQNSLFKLSQRVKTGHSLFPSALTAVAAH